jgi:hypothetical protein
MLLPERRGIRRFDFSNQQLTLPAKKCQFFGLFANDIFCRNHFASKYASKASLFETGVCRNRLAISSVNQNLTVVKDDSRSLQNGGRWFWLMARASATRGTNQN